MKKKLLIVFLAFSCVWTPEVRPMGYLDFLATCIVASYAYHGWCYWTNAQHGKPATEIIKELKSCLEVLKQKVTKEQQDIDECRETLTRLRMEMDYYKNVLGIKEAEKERRRLEEEQGYQYA